ncbi:hypothetical protein NVP2275O_075 [Vibrio phage 2.275.O._10N.286.54.E11]|nr:hypothetical protein NVP2275O_075 [Vibrio phage 2.275.O._10N.286.54.E11]
MKKLFIASFISMAASSVFASVDSELDNDVELAPFTSITQEQSITAMSKVYSIAQVAELQSDYCLVDIKAGKPTSENCDGFVKSMADMSVQFDIVDVHKSAAYRSLTMSQGMGLLASMTNFEITSYKLREAAPELISKHNPYSETEGEVEESTLAEGTL